MSLIVKIIGSVLIITASVSVGWSKSKQLSNRKVFLQEFIAFLTTLSTNFRFNSADIFTLTALSLGEKLAANISFANPQNLSFEQIWQMQIKILPRSYSLKKQDISLLNEFGAELGKTDVEGQLKHIELYKSLFTKQLYEAEELIVQKSKLYKTLGLFVGISIVLVII